ncbi:GrpB family protein [bacterium]|nr:GrpB family protein [bacterium]
MKKPIVIVEYDPRWSPIFLEEKRVIVQTIGDFVIDIEHIGSTAVPGLGAKPVVDIMATVDSAECADQCLPRLAKIGYDDVTPQPGQTEWFYCLGKSPDSTDGRFQYFHLHLVLAGSGFFKKHLLFRDYLRNNPEVARDYYRLKVKLAARYGSDRLGYNEAKTEFIESALADAVTGST